jgi:ligand-binding SRPBCC domain-containing protein
MASTSKTEEKAIAGVTSGLIGLGERVTWQARHFGIVQTLTVEIVRFERPFTFQDKMVQGIFARLEHTHTFESLGPRQTRMRDEFLFNAPLGPLGWLAEHCFLTAYMRHFLIERNQFLKQVAESDTGWRRFLPERS